MKRARQRDLAALACLALALGCSPEPRDASIDGLTDAGSEVEAGSSEPPRPPPEPPLGDDFTCEPTLASIKTAIFEHACYWDTCHSNNGAAFGLRLVIDEAAVYDELVGARTACNGAELVSPGHPERSYLMEKLTAETPACGARMPWGYQPLPAEAIACIAGWIESLSDPVDGGLDGGAR